MSDLLLLIKDIQADKKIPALDEARTKNGVILPILQALGWNPFNIDEIHPEYTIGGKKVDYSLRYGNQNKAFIEVKQAMTDLEKHQEQLLNYSFQEGVRLAILTNGIAWWFYLPLHEGNWEERKFYSIDIYAQPAEEIAQRFEDFLLKHNIMSGRANENAESVFRSKQKSDTIRNSIPKAWNKLVTEPDEALVELVAATTEKLGGYRPEHSTVIEFLRANPSLAVISVKPPYTYVTTTQHKVEETDAEEDHYEYTVVSSFTLKGTRYEAKHWKDVLIGVTNVMLEKHPAQFSRVLELRGSKNPWFSRDPDELNKAEKIDDTDIYIDTRKSARRIVVIARAIIDLFGYTEDDLQFEFVRGEFKKRERVLKNGKSTFFVV